MVQLDIKVPNCHIIAQTLLVIMFKEVALDKQISKRHNPSVSEVGKPKASDTTAKDEERASPRLSWGNSLEP